MRTTEYTESTEKTFTEKSNIHHSAMGKRM